MNELIWTPIKRNVADLKKLPTNPRKISKEAFEKLKQRIAERGMHDVVKVDTDDFILSGNQRYDALTELNVAEVWALTPNRPLTREERDKVILESNRTDGEWDFKILSNDFDITTLHDVGFTDKDLGIFAPVSLEQQGQLDKTEVSGEITCPACGHSWEYKKTIKHS